MSPFHEAPQGVLMQIALYARPLDYRQGYVVRAWYIAQGRIGASKAAQLFDDERSARVWVRRNYPWVYELGRMPDDEPQIVTVWT